MSKINTIRLINFNYNNNSIQVGDEVFHLNGENTLLSLRNGGGKSVLVQMITAPFVHKRYRDAKDRPFESYFTTSKPTFILVEWVLDRGAGYVLTGMMVRKNQDVGEQGNQGLDIVNIISEYTQPCLADINNIPVVEKGKKGIVLKPYSTCRQLFEDYKKDRNLKFFCYDMENQAQSRQYFLKLMEYQINYKEWEDIIKKVNLRESGLSELFADCKDEKGLVEKWFLDTVGKKLNRDSDRIKEFQSIVGKYVALYKDNRSKIKRRDTIRMFKEDGIKIQEKAEIYRDEDKKKSEHENKIADFIHKLGEVRESVDLRRCDIQSEIEGIMGELEYVEYEKLSKRIYGLKDKLGEHTISRQVIEMERDKLEDEVRELKRYLNLLLCAKQQDKVSEDERELAQIKEKLIVARREDTDLEPERKYLGYMLKLLYERELAENEGRQERNNAACNDVKNEIKEGNENISKLDTDINRLSSRRGALEENIKQYDSRESEFNGKYREDLSRNILGEYEAGMLDIKREVYEKEIETVGKTRNDLLNQREKTKENIARLRRDREDFEKLYDRYHFEKEQQERLKGEYDKELEKRRTIMSCLALNDSFLFDGNKIVSSCESKLVELAEYRRKLEIEEDILQKELDRLATGRIMELPKELEEELANMGIHIIYGMEWLKKNEYAQEDKLELVRKNPFLPYSLILSGKELERLQKNAGSIYTSFPIPIVCREQLDKISSMSGENVISFDGVSFYVLFNENLLDEEKLAKLIDDKRRLLNQKREIILRRKKEYDEYSDMLGVIKNQKVDRDKYDLNGEQIKELDEKLDRTQEKLKICEGQLDENESLQEGLETKIKAAEKQAEYQVRRLEDYTLLCDEYDKYIQRRAELVKCRKDEEWKSSRKRDAMAKVDELRIELGKLDLHRDELTREQDGLRKKLVRYQEYEECEKPSERSAKTGETDLSVMELRFDAISEHSQEVSVLVAQEKKAIERYRKSLDELEHLYTKCALERDSWRGVTYTRKDEEENESILEDRNDKIEVKKREWNEEDKQIALISQRINDCMDEMQNKCHKESPLPKSEVKDKDFDGEKNKLEYRKNELEKQSDECMRYIRSYDELLTALAEYDTFTVKEELEWEDFSKMTPKRLRDFKGMLVRDYNHCKDDLKSARDGLTDVLNRTIRKDEFKDDYYRKPLESMLDLCDDGAQVLKQLATTIQSYDDLMEKLEVDISMVEKEKDKIVELLEDYIREVHVNLGKIDANSTITIRGRALKMLKIELPQWEENENLYHLRLQDMVDEITGKGIEIFERNENAQEYFGARLTTEKLYDTVIGIGNVQIKLYKIEEQREYPITWAQVARNSGGEGFLSAFIILSSLLYYMRKDDTDIFADRNEGKVLLMDNPFAQTNASHLLKPLMDMSVKTNTQLICLTGLGGESIYNRFDNIYVINLIAASLRNSMQYVKANHVKGNEPDTLVTSRIEVMEQQELKLF